jgi:hypothetical protein
MGWPVDSEATDVAEEQVEAILSLYRRRASIIAPELFGDPAWEVLLRLFLAKLRRRKIKLSDLKDVGPQSTLARWAAILQERGLVTCALNRLDSGDLWIELTSNGAARMSALFDNPDHSHRVRWSRLPEPLR